VGDEEMTERAYIQDRKDETDQCASREDFCRIFTEDLDGLYQLSFLLTRDPQKAEQCFVGGLEDCVAGNPIFREWARSWAKRAIVQNAISELKPRPGLSNSPTSAAIFLDTNQRSSGRAHHFEFDAVFGLEDYERFVFVMSVLEHYSQDDCALLLGCSVPEVQEARTRALKELAASPHMDRPQNHIVRSGEEVK
jgi:DNA-directed RNA polymerase specialized sigma24 family protein